MEMDESQQASASASVQMEQVPAADRAGPDLLIDSSAAPNSEPVATVSARDSEAVKICDEPLLHSPSLPPDPADTADQQGPAAQQVELPTAEAHTTAPPPLGGADPVGQVAAARESQSRADDERDEAPVAAGGDAGSSQGVPALSPDHDDHLWAELINSPAFSEWNQKQEELAQRAVAKASDDGRQSMLLEDDSEPKLDAIEEDGETAEAGAREKKEKEEEAEAEATSPVRERKQKRKRKSEKKKKKGRRTSSNGAKKAKRVNDSDAEKEKEEGENQQTAAPLGDDDGAEDDNDPFSLPLRTGWTREVVTRQSGATAKIRKDVYYHAPDGKKLRSRVEVSKYLVQKGITDLSIENFSYNWKQEVKLSEKRKASKDYPLAFGNAERIDTAERRKKKKKRKAAKERKARKYTRQSSSERRSKPRKAAKPPKPELLRIDDISEGKERVPIECVNVRSDERPEPFEYISTSIIHPSIAIRFDVPFVCCSCTDGCTDPTKCECIIKTQEFAGATVPRSTYDSNGRVPDDYPMIMECGRLCKCAGKPCSNRATQDGIKFRLQLFRTKHKGWGIRTLEDIPSGSFVMEYVGEIITNEMAETVKSDTYLLDLDMLETMEQWRRQRAAEMEQDRLAAATAAEAEAEAKAKVKIEQAGDDKEPTKRRKRRRKTGVSWSSKTARRKKPTATFDTRDSLPIDLDLNNDDEEFQDEISACLAAEESDVTPRPSWPTTTTTATGEEAPPKEPTSEPRLFTSLTLRDEVECDDGADWHVARSQMGVPDSEEAEEEEEEMEEEKEKEEEPEENEEEDSNSIGLRVQLYGEDEPYVVNPHKQGNIARFINHSCNPNLWIVPVVSGLQDLRLAKPCFFAGYDIPQGYELTWDYQMSPGAKGQQPCLCGSYGCRGVL